MRKALVVANILCNQRKVNLRREKAYLAFEEKGEMCQQSMERKSMESKSWNP